MEVSYPPKFELLAPSGPSANIWDKQLPKAAPARHRRMRASPDVITGLGLLTTYPV